MSTGSPMQDVMGPSALAAIRRVALAAFAVGLAVAGGLAIAAILARRPQETDWRWVATSFSFSIFSALGATGLGAWRRTRVLTVAATIALVSSTLSFGYLMDGIWNQLDDTGWRTVGVLVLVSFASAHACLVLRARRPEDSWVITLAVVASILAAAFDSVVGSLATAGAIDAIDLGLARALGVAVIVLLVTSVQPPILRRLRPEQRGAPPLLGTARVDGGIRGGEPVLVDRVQ